MKKTITLEVECGSCGGTGIYVDFRLKKGEGIICLNCDGEGKVEVEYTKFTGRKLRKGITTVFRSRRPDGKNGVYPNPIPYQEFLAGKMPETSSPN